MITTAMVLISFLATLVRSTFGFGESLVAVPLFVLFLSGVLGGAYGVNGPPLVVYGNLRRWSAKQFRATLQAYFLVASLIGVMGYAIKGLVGRVVLTDLLVCLPVVLPTIFLGRYFNRKLRGSTFYTYVYWGLMGIGFADRFYYSWNKKLSYDQ